MRCLCRVRISLGLKPLKVDDGAERVAQQQAAQQKAADAAAQARTAELADRVQECGPELKQSIKLDLAAGGWTLLCETHPQIDPSGTYPITSLSG